MLSQEIFIQGKNFAILGCLRAKDRLKRLLYEIIVEVEPLSDFKKKIGLQVPLKHREMAQMIAVTLEHLSRLLKALEHDGVIKRDGNLLTVKNASGLMAECKI
jgi:CRP-like cAMP-binding protein